MGTRRIDVLASLEGLAERLEELADGAHKLPVANAVAGKLFELAVNDAAQHVDTGRMLETLDFYVEPEEVGVQIQPYKRFVAGLALRAGIPKKWRAQLVEAGRQALEEVLRGRR